MFIDVIKDPKSNYNLISSLLLTWYLIPYWWSHVFQWRHWFLLLFNWIEEDSLSPFIRSSCPNHPCVPWIQMRLRDFISFIRSMNTYICTVRHNGHEIHYLSNSNGCLQMIMPMKPTIPIKPHLCLVADRYKIEQVINTSL